jgi:hypothetical protein
MIFYSDAFKTIPYQLELSKSNREIRTLFLNYVGKPSASLLLLPSLPQVAHVFVPVSSSYTPLAVAVDAPSSPPHIQLVQLVTSNSVAYTFVETLTLILSLVGVAHP